VKGVWNSATTMSGAQCVMTSGVLLMLMLYADSWDSLPQVTRFISEIVTYVYMYHSCIYCRQHRHCESSVWPGNRSYLPGQCQLCWY
jgi:hypothetical protein